MVGGILKKKNLKEKIKDNGSSDKFEPNNIPKNDFVKVELLILKDSLKRFYDIMDDAHISFKGLKEVKE